MEMGSIMPKGYSDIMERSLRQSEKLEPDERELARRMFGDLPEPQLAAALLDAYDRSEIEQFGSPEAAASHYAMVHRLEADMIADLEALEQRVKGL
jgi:hypothetical protein